MAISGAITIFVGGLILGYAFKAYLIDSKREA
jgi:hypothetical protein